MAKKNKWTGPLAMSIGNPGAPAYNGPLIAGGPDHAWLAKRKARLDEAAREAAIRREELVDTATLDKLEKSFPVPQEKRGAFYSSVRAAVGELRRGWKVQPWQPRRKPILAATDEYQAAVNKVRELITPDYAALRVSRMTSDANAGFRVFSQVAKRFAMMSGPAVSALATRRYIAEAVSS